MNRNIDPRPSGPPIAPVASTGGVFKRALTALAEHRVWTTVGAVAGIAGVVLFAIQLAAPSEGGGPELEVAALGLGSPEQIDGISGSSIPDDPQNPDNFDVSPVDITLKNNGGAQSVITKVTAEVLYSAYLQDCTDSGAGPAKITANYAIRFPLGSKGQYGDLIRGPLSTALNFVVKPGSVDRMQVTVGPDDQGGNPGLTVLAVKISLVHDGSQVLEVGTVALGALEERIEEQINGVRVTGGFNEIRDPECAKENLIKIDEMYAVAPVRSASLDRLRQKYEEFARQ